VAEISFSPQNARTHFNTSDCTIPGAYFGPLSALALSAQNEHSAIYVTGQVMNKSGTRTQVEL
jgi:hypothetical protein